MTRFFMSFLALGLVFTPACKFRGEASSAKGEGTSLAVCDTDNYSGDSGGSVAPCLIKWAYKGDDEKVREWIYLGVWQPDGSIYYLPQGMARLERIIWNSLQTRHIEGTYRQTLRDNASTDVLSYQISRHTVPAEIIPVALWKNGVYFSYFLIPTKAFEPDVVEATYWKLQHAANFVDPELPADQVEPMKRAMPLYRVDPIAFRRLIALYRQTFNLPVMATVREEVRRDQAYQQAASNLFVAEQTATSMVMSLTFSAAGKILFPPGTSAAVTSSVSATTDVVAKAFYSRAFSWMIGQASAAGGTMIRGIPSALFYVIVPGYIDARFREAQLGDHEYMDRKYKRDAKAHYGVAGIRYHAEDTSAYQPLVAARDKFPALADFISDPFIRDFLLDPVGTYALNKMLDTVKAADLNLLKDLKTGGTAGRDRLLDRLERNAKAGGLPFVRARVSQLLDIGLKSPFFAEMMTLALAKKPGFTVVVTNTYEEGMRLVPGGGPSNPGGVLGFNRNDIDWSLVVEQLDTSIGAANATGWTAVKNQILSKLARLSVTSKDRLQVYTLGHEMWHKFKDVNLTGEVTRFANASEFVRAAATDDVVALLAGKRVRDDLMGTGGAGATMLSVLERINLFSIETQMAFRDPNWVLQTTVMPSLRPTCTAFLTDLLGEGEIR